MYEILTNQFGDKYRRIDLHNIRIEGRLAHNLALPELHSYCKKMNVPRIEPQHGKQDVLIRIGVWQLEEWEANEARTSGSDA